MYSQSFDAAVGVASGVMVSTLCSVPRQQWPVLEVSLQALSWGDRLKNGSSTLDDYSACATLIDRARASTLIWIGDGGLERPCGVPHEMIEHDHRPAPNRTQFA